MMRSIPTHCSFQGKQWKAAALLLSEMRWATCDVGAEAYTGPDGFTERTFCLKIWFNDRGKSRRLTETYR